MNDPNPYESPKEEQLREVPKLAASYNPQPWWVILVCGGIGFAAGFIAWHRTWTFHQPLITGAVGTLAGLLMTLRSRVRDPWTADAVLVVGIVLIALGICAVGAVLLVTP